MDIRAYWDAVLRQDAQGMRGFLHPEAEIKWPNTKERFNRDEFIRANCEYPGSWAGELLRTEVLGELVITVAKVRSVDGALAFHAVSFIELKDDKIISLEEYWGDDGPPPEWRQKLRLGGQIG